MRTRFFLAVTVAALLLAGCSDGEGDGGDGDPTTTAVTGDVTSTTGAPVATTVAPAVAVTTTTAPAAGAVVLRPDGLGVATFGDSKEVAISALSAALGGLDETGTGCELGGPGSTTARWKELRAEFAPDGTFRSYNIRPPGGATPSLGLETEAGIGLGSTVGQLKAIYGSRLTIPGLPAEFGGDNFAVSFPGTDRQILGTLTGTTDGGAVTAIFTSVCE